MNWPLKRLDELGAVGRGKSRHRPRNDPALYGGPYPFIQTAEVKHADLYITAYEQTYSEAGLAQSKLWPVGTLCITIAANIAETSILGIDACFPDSVVGFIADPKKSDTRFVKYAFDVAKTRFQQISPGAAQDNLSLEKLFSLKMPIPEKVDDQRRIADVLSAYDELIETNRRRMGLLEEAARLLYREWFVRLRHPACAKATARQPGHPRTGLPAGWRTVAASEAIEVNPTVKIPKDAPTPWVEMADLATDSMVLAPSENRVGGSGTRFQNGDTLMARITPCLENGKTGYVAFLPEGGAARGSTEFIVLRGRTVTPEFVYCFARDENTRQHAMRSMVGASGRQRVHASCFDKLTIVEPSAAALSEFTKIARPLFEQVHTLHRQNRQLRAARDLLLPKLMRGRIAV